MNTTVYILVGTGVITIVYFIFALVRWVINFKYGNWNA